MQTSELNSLLYLNLVRKIYENLRACFLHIDIMHYSMATSMGYLQTRRARFSQLLRTSNPEKCFDVTSEAPKTLR